MPFSLIPDRVLDRYSDVTPQMLESCGVKLLLVRPGLHPGPQIRPQAGRGAAGVAGELPPGAASPFKISLILSTPLLPPGGDLLRGSWRIDYVGHAGSPLSGATARPLDRAGIGPERTAMLGDKLLTDVLGPGAAACWP